MQRADRAVQPREPRAVRAAAARDRRAVLRRRDREQLPLDPAARRDDVARVVPPVRVALAAGRRADRPGRAAPTSTTRASLPASGTRSPAQSSMPGRSSARAARRRRPARRAAAARTRAGRCSGCRIWRTRTAGPPISRATSPSWVVVATTTGRPAVRTRPTPQPPSASAASAASATAGAAGAAPADERARRPRRARTPSPASTAIAAPGGTLSWNGEPQPADALGRGERDRREPATGACGR